VTKSRLINQLAVGDHDVQQNNDSEMTRANYSADVSFLEDVASSDLQFHSIRMTNRSVFVLHGIHCYQFMVV